MGQGRARFGGPAQTGQTATAGPAFAGLLVPLYGWANRRAATNFSQPAQIVPSLPAAEDVAIVRLCLNMAPYTSRSVINKDSSAFVVYAFGTIMRLARQPYVGGLTQLVGYGVVLLMAVVAAADAQPPANYPEPIECLCLQVCRQTQLPWHSSRWPPARPRRSKPPGPPPSMPTRGSRQVNGTSRRPQSGWDAARAERMPSLTLGADYYALSESPAVVSTIPGLGTLELPIANRDSGGGHAFVTQPIYTSGRISSGIDAAEANVVAQEADHNKTILDVKMDVAEIYVKVLLATRIVEVAESKAVSLSSHDKDVSALFEKGVVSKNDLLASHVALADAQQKAIDARAGLGSRSGRLQPRAGAESGPTGISRRSRGPGSAAPIEELTQIALSRRPELTGLSAQARALQDEAASVRGKSGPQVVVAGGYLYQQDDYIRPNGYTGAMVGVEWNPLDFGRVKSQARVLDEKSQSLIRLRRDAESKIALQVRQKWIDLQTARQRVVVARTTTAQADENLRVARDRYQHQAGTNTEVLDAETLRVQAYMNFYSSTYQAALAGLRLRRAVGTL